MVIIDEVSMLSPEQLVEMEGRMRLLMECYVDFGALHICRDGDFYQMPPIGASFLFVDSAAARAASDARLRSIVRARMAAARRQSSGAPSAVALRTSPSPCGLSSCSVSAPVDGGRSSSSDDCLRHQESRLEDFAGPAPPATTRVHAQLRPKCTLRDVVIIFGACSTTSSN